MAVSGQEAFPKYLRPFVCAVIGLHIDSAFHPLATARRGSCLGLVVPGCGRMNESTQK